MITINNDASNKSVKSHDLPFNITFTGTIKGHPDSYLFMTVYNCPHPAVPAFIDMLDPQKYWDTNVQIDNYREVELEVTIRPINT